jgi:serine/threonine-protein kinase
MTDLPTSKRSLFGNGIAAIKEFFRRNGPHAVFDAAAPTPSVDDHAAEATLHRMNTQSLTKISPVGAELPSKGRISISDPPQTDLLYRVGDLIDDQFRVESFLSGGMGIVYICRCIARTVNAAGESISAYPEGDQSDPRSRFAIKSFYRRYIGHADMLKRFRQEALLWISLPPHPNIVRAWTFSNLPLLVLEYIDGGNLRANMQSGPLPEDEVIRISIEFCHGMCFLMESAGIIHRDIKPENILLTRLGTIKITDLGLAKALRSTTERDAPAASATASKGNDSLTECGTIVGTLPYMSPEQYIGFHELSVASDIYSFGVVLYEMLTGHRPFLGRNYVEWREKHSHELPPPPSEISNAPMLLSKVTMKCLEKRPDHRFRNFGELRAELESHARSSGRHFLVTAAPSISELEARMTATEWNGRGVALAMLGEPERACESHKQALAIAPKAPSMNSNVGTALLKLGRLEEALQYFEKEVELHPKHGLAYDSLSAGYFQAGKFDQALVAIRKAAELVPDHPPVLRRYALQAGRAQSMTDYERAMARLRTLLNASQSAPTLIDQAIQFCQAGDLKDGLEFHALSVKRFPDSAASWYNYGVTLHKLGKKDEALACYTQAIKRDKALTLAWTNRGLIRAERGDRIGSDADWRSAVASDPAHDVSRILTSLPSAPLDPQFPNLIQRLAVVAIRYFF